MSKKNDILLHRKGRNQFGIEPGDLPYPQNIDRWPQIKRQFVDKYKEQWLGLFSGLNKKQIWKLLYEDSEFGFARMSLSSFYSEVKSRSMESYLEQYLLSHKERALTILGLSKNERHEVIKEFNAKFWG